jgi:hypothetical protein
LEECSGGTIAPVSQSISVDPPSSGYLYRFVSTVPVYSSRHLDLTKRFTFKCLDSLLCGRPKKLNCPSGLIKSDGT